MLMNKNEVDLRDVVRTSGHFDSAQCDNAGDRSSVNCCSSCVTQGSSDWTAHSPVTLNGVEVPVMSGLPFKSTTLPRTPYPGHPERSRKTHPAPRFTTHSSGAVLLMVLVLSAIMYLIASTLLLITMSEVHISDFEQRSIQALYAADSSATLGLSKLQQDPNYRTTTSDSFLIGGNTVLLNVRFYDGTNDGNGYFLGSLEPSLYRLVLRGKGTVPGLHAAAKRTVERNVVLKPFALFAGNNVKLSGGADITGNIHGNNVVTIGLNSHVTGNVTSNRLVFQQGTVTDTVSSLEPAISFPMLQGDQYFPKYRYEGAEYEVQPLIHDTVELLPAGKTEPPAPSIEVYSGFPTTDNPAGFFYLNTDLPSDTLTAILVTGTVIIPSSGTLTLDGIVRITPVANFPALISAKNLRITFIGNLEKFSKGLKKSHILGMIYVWGNVSFTGNNLTENILRGSILGWDITVSGNPIFPIEYDPAIFSAPPPGIHFIEFGEWRERFE